MPSDLWSFSLDTYARPGVEDACLRLRAPGAASACCSAQPGSVRGVLPVASSACKPFASRLALVPRRGGAPSAIAHVVEAAAAADPQLATLRTQVKALELAAEQQLIGRSGKFGTGLAGRSSDRLDRVAGRFGDGRRQP